LISNLDIPPQYEEFTPTICICRVFFIWRMTPLAAKRFSEEINLSHRKRRKMAKTGADAL
jgi:hypothetical protein